MANPNPLTAVTITPKSQHIYSIIWLHGLGANGDDFKNIVPELQLTKAANIHFIFPNAPVQPITINNGMQMPAWYDVLDKAMAQCVDSKGIYQSVAWIRGFIQQEISSGVASKNIILAGFSQGGVIALHTALVFPSALGGVIGLSTYLPTLENLAKERSDKNQNIPIFIGHGNEDTVIDMRAGEKIYQDLLAWNYPVQWHQYVMQHSVCLPEINDIAQFINAIFK